MKKRKPGYNFFQKALALVMIKTLLWLTVSTPVLYKFQCKENEAAIALSQPFETGEETGYMPAPLNGTSEEKTEITPSNCSEFLHKPNELKTVSVLLNYFTNNADAEYIAYHCDLLSPPPRV